MTDSTVAALMADYAACMLAKPTHPFFRKQLAQYYQEITRDHDIEQ